MVDRLFKDWYKAKRKENMMFCHGGQLKEGKMLRTGLYSQEKRKLTSKNLNT